MTATLDGVRLFSLLTMACMIASMICRAWSHYMIVSRKMETGKKVKG